MGFFVFTFGCCTEFIIHRMDKEMYSIDLKA